MKNYKACKACKGTGYDPRTSQGRLVVWCKDCEGVGFTNIEPNEPCDDHPGSDRKVAMMAARYAKGESLYHPEDNVLSVSSSERTSGSGSYSLSLPNGGVG